MGTALTTYTGPVCPVTHCKEVEMFRSVFFSMCKSAQRKVAMCKECRGNLLPWGLTLVDDPTTPGQKQKTEAIHVGEKEERKMPQKKCEVCDHKRALKMHKGKESCTTCRYIRTAADNTPEILADAIIEFCSPEHIGRLFNLPGLASQGESKLSEDNARLRKQVDEANRRYSSTLGKLGSMKKAMNEKDRLIAELKSQKIGPTTGIESEPQRQEHETGEHAAIEKQLQLAIDLAEKNEAVSQDLHKKLVKATTAKEELRELALSLIHKLASIGTDMAKANLRQQPFSLPAEEIISLMEAEAVISIQGKCDEHHAAEESAVQ